MFHLHVFFVRGSGEACFSRTRKEDCNKSQRHTNYHFVTKKAKPLYISYNVVVKRGSKMWDKG